MTFRQALLETILIGLLLPVAIAFVIARLVKHRWLSPLTFIVVVVVADTVIFDLQLRAFGVH